MDHRSHQCTAVRRKDHDHYDRRLAGNPGVLRGGSRDRRGRLLEKLRYITLPLLLPAITTSVVLNLIGGLKLFGIILSTTSGGPGYSSHSLSTLINYLYFQNQNAGYSAAVGLCLFVIIMILGTVVRRFLEKKVEGLSL